MDLQEHYESVDRAIRTMLDEWARSSLKLSDVVRKVRRAFPRARVREIYLLLIQHCANHPRSVFVHTTENRLVLKDGTFLMASRDVVIAAVAPFDAFLCYLIQALTFLGARALPAESTIEAATGFVGALQVVLVEEIVAAGLLVMEDVPGELPRYVLQSNFDWDGRYLLFARSASVWAAQKASAVVAVAVTDGSDDGDAMHGVRYGRDAPSVLDQIWRPVRVTVPARSKPTNRAPMRDEALSRLLKSLFKGQSFNAPNRERLASVIAAQLAVPREMVVAIFDGTDGAPTAVRCVDDGDAGWHVEIDPALTWDALAAYPRTQEVCEQFLKLG